MVVAGVDRRAHAPHDGVDCVAVGRASLLVVVGAGAVGGDEPGQRQPLDVLLGQEQVLPCREQLVGPRRHARVGEQRQRVELAAQPGVAVRAVLGEGRVGARLLEHGAGAVAHPLRQVDAARTAVAERRENPVAVQHRVRSASSTGSSGNNSSTTAAAGRRACGCRPMPRRRDRAAWPPTCRRAGRHAQPGARRSGSRGNASRGSGGR